MKILVVDDEADMQPLFEQHFRKEIKSSEMNFVFAQSGSEALEILNHENHEFILILSDINMPGMSGLELLQTVKEKYLLPPPKVIMITAYGDEYNYQQAMNFGADDFLTKPLDFKELKLKLKTNEL
ncbi:MAG: response regulator [Ginsengibacter sp.]|jgi:CheY-like chemotaxis protein